jgi:hypothetical protein
MADQEKTGKQKYGEGLEAFGSLLSIVSNLEGGYKQANAIRDQGDYERSRFWFNAEVADTQARDAFNIGEENRIKFLGKAKKLEGRQRVAIAMGGTALNKGSALKVQEDTAAAVAADASTIRSNAWRQAWGFKTQAHDLRQRADLAFKRSRSDSYNTEQAANNQAITSVIGSVAKFVAI